MYSGVYTFVCVCVCARARTRKRLRCIHAQRHTHPQTLQNSGLLPLFSCQPSFQNSTLTFASSEYAPVSLPTTVGKALQSAKTTYLSPNIHMDIHTNIHACIHTCIHRDRQTDRTDRQTGQTDRQTYIHTCIHTHMHACIHVRTSIHICI